MSAANLYQFCFALFFWFNPSVVSLFLIGKAFGIGKLIHANFGFAFFCLWFCLRRGGNSAEKLNNTTFPTFATPRSGLLNRITEFVQMTMMIGECASWYGGRN